MTALMICCMAMYFSVISSRSTQYAVFYQKQSYQSAVSLSDSLLASMITGTGGFEGLGQKIWNLDVGGKITTDANGFKTFDSAGSGADDDNFVGAYMMEATRLPDETLADGSTVRVFDIIITTSVNGSKEIYHNIIQMSNPATPKPLPGPTNVFTATGYVPNAVFLDGGSIKTDVFFDNEDTILQAYGGKEMTLKGNLAAGGSLTINKYLNLTSDSPTYFAVRDTFTSYTNNPLTFAEPTGSSEIEKNKTRSTVIIGGDCYLINGAKFKNANVYVLGDLHLRGDGLDSSCKYFVDGNIYLEKGQYGGYWHNLSNVYCNGTVDASQNTGGGINGALAGKWTGSVQGKETDGLMTVTEMINLLEEKTATVPYYKWAVDTTGLPEKTITFSTDNSNPSPTYLLKYSESEKGCIINDIKMYAPNNASGWKNSCTLVIDTGEDPDNIYTIQVKANRDYLDNKPGNDTFCWYPRNSVNGATTWVGNGSNVFFRVLVMGRGSVVIDIPPGVTYQDDDHLQLMHYGWFLLNGGQEHYYGDADKQSNDAYRKGHTAYYYSNPDTKINESVFSQYIHYGCKSGDGCSYTTEETDIECGVCGNKYVNAKCDKHGTVDTYCATCQASRGVSHVGKCNNHVDRPKVDAYLNSHPDIKAKMTGKDGKIIYPNVNIFLVSCDENADIRLSSRAASTATGSTQTFIENAFFGYVYAPYLTFKAGPSNTGGGQVRLMGGLTVSDYIIDDAYSILACYPDKLPMELMDDSCFDSILGGITNKSWKIVLKSH